MPPNVGHHVQDMIREKSRTMSRFIREAVRNYT